MKQGDTAIINKETEVVVYPHLTQPVMEYHSMVCDLSILPQVSRRLLMSSWSMGNALWKQDNDTSWSIQRFRKCWISACCCWRDILNRLFVSSRQQVWAWLAVKDASRVWQCLITWAASAFSFGLWSHKASISCTSLSKSMHVSPWSSSVISLAWGGSCLI